MNALILAAGLGTRLKPYTEKVPKPLFPVAGTSLLDLAISQLAMAGCQKIVINTHHLADQIHAHLETHEYLVPIAISHEPEILGTGGAVQKAASLLGEKPFFVVNSDIVHAISLASIYQFHLQHHHPATLVLVDDPNFNTVWLDTHGHIRHFQRQAYREIRKGRWSTFSGIQVVDPLILKHIPIQGFYSIIDAYRSLIQNGHKIQGYFVKKSGWLDLGTPNRFQQAVYKKIAPTLFSQNIKANDQKVSLTPLAGDGSERRWSRLKKNDQTLILCEHGITIGTETQEVDAFVAIGKHLHNTKVRVPKILHHDRFSGQVYLEDLGNTHLQVLVASTTNPAKVFNLYDAVIRRLFDLAVKGIVGFDPVWTYQTTKYDKDLILEKECRYFLDAFVNGWCGQSETWATYAAEFKSIAGTIETFGAQGLVHRDMQSRNVMMKTPDEPYFIDFQGARLGPVQYDLASLLIDPYVNLPEELRVSITQKALKFYTDRLDYDQEKFDRGFIACAVSRNLQILGAFANLAQNKGKTFFAQYIPDAFERLQISLATYKMTFGSDLLPQLSCLVVDLKHRLP